MFVHMLRQVVTISSGQTDSSECESLGLTLVAIETPAALTGTELAVHGSHTSGSLLAAYDDVGAAIAAQVGPSRYVAMGWSKLVAKYVKVVSNAAEAGDRSIVLIFGEV